LKSRSDIQINSLNDAKQYHISSQKGHASTEYLLEQGFEAGKHLSISYNNDQHIKMLLHDRVDLIVLSSSLVQSLIVKDSPYIDIIEAAFAIDSLKNNIYLASNLNTSPVLINKIRKAYDELMPVIISEFHD
jgi:polar amino acid transport system substrate-binding protein